RRSRALLAAAFAAFPLAAAPARAAVPHTVTPGETLWSIAAANNFTTRTIAAFNGLSEDAGVYAGETIEIPTESEGATASSSTGSSGDGSGSPSTATTSSGSHTVTAGESLSSIA